MDGLQEKSMLRVLMKITRMTGTALALILCFIASQTFAGDQSSTYLKMRDVSKVLNTAQEKAEELKLPENGQTDDCGCQEAAGKVMGKFNSPDFQAKMRDEQQRLQETVFKDILAQSLPEADQNPITQIGRAHV